MANYIPYVRSNYFKVKDVEKFEAFLKDNECELIEQTFNDSPLHEGETLYGFICKGENGLPTSSYDEETDEEGEFDFIGELAKHLIPGALAEVREVGYDKMRYLIGITTVVDHAGNAITVSLDDIYDKALEKWGAGAVITNCSY